MQNDEVDIFKTQVQSSGYISKREVLVIFSKNKDSYYVLCFYLS